MQQKKPQQQNPENPANTGGKERVPGYPQEKNPAGTPNPPKDEFPGEPPKVYASQQGQRGAEPKRGQDRQNPDTNQPPRRDQDPRQAKPGEPRQRDDDANRRKQSDTRDPVNRQ